MKFGKENGRLKYKLSPGERTIEWQMLEGVYGGGIEVWS